MLTRFAAAFACFEAPEEWVPGPPFGLREPGDEDDACSASLQETWLKEQLPAAELVTQRVAALPSIYEGFTVVGDTARDVPAGLSGHTLTFSYRDLDQRLRMERRILIVQGPLLVELTIAWPAGVDTRRERVIEAVAASFELADSMCLGESTQTPLMSCATTALSAPAGERRAFPRVAAELPLIEGWEASATDTEAVFENGSSEVRVRRAIGTNIDTDAWLTGRIERAKEAQSMMLAWDRGELPTGWEYVALKLDEKGLIRTWGSASVRHILQALVKGEQPFEWTVSAPMGKFPAAAAAFGSLVAGLVMMDGEDWETKVAEEWVDLVLEGPWRPEAAGVYVNIDHGPTLLYLGRQESNQPLDRLAPSIVKSFDSGLDIKTKLSDRESLGVFRGLSAFHYLLDAELWDGSRVHLRTAWIAQEKLVYSCTVQSPDAELATSLLAKIMDSIKLPGARV